MTEYKVGDKLHLEVTVTHNKPSYAFMTVEYPTFDPEGLRVGTNILALSRCSTAIVKHIPKPREINVGDVFKNKITHTEYDVVSIDGGHVWCKILDGRHYTWPLNILQDENRFIQVK